MEINAQQFASDNYSGVCPEALEALVEANKGHETSYGDDSWTKRACDLFRELFETDCEVFFVFNGTAANSLALASLCKPFHSVICHETGHVEIREGDEIELIPNGTGKLEVSLSERRRQALEEMRRLSVPLPAGYKFDREEANVRDPYEPTPASKTGTAADG